MSEESTQREPDRRILAELSALAEGTLAPERAERVRELIAGSPELAARYERERSAVLALRSLTADRAPANLRFAIEARRSRSTRRRHPMIWTGALATAALAAILFILLLPGGSPGAPAVSQAAALALRGPTAPAPGHDGANKLSASVGALYFPDWSQGFGWRPVGARTDRLDGKLAVTVYYAHAGKRIAYTIVAAPPLHWSSAQMRYLDGVQLQSFVLRGRQVVTWRRAGDTCVLSGVGVTTSQLAALVGWNAPGLG